MADERGRAPDYAALVRALTNPKVIAVGKSLLVRYPRPAEGGHDQTKETASKQTESVNRKGFLDYVQQIEGIAEAALASRHVSGEDAELIGSFRNDVGFAAADLVKIADGLPAHQADHMFLALWELVSRVHQLGARTIITRPARSYCKSEEAKKHGGKGGARGKEKAAEWKASLLPIAAALDQRASPLSREDMASELYQRGARVSHKSILNWLKDEAEAPHGPIKSRARARKTTS